ncbi:MAG: hypothetical protein N2483_08090, partial [Burkholderiaceae bacterium]|nr:hypothetical protein [Burkholderiaceae bacterium]
MRAARRLANVVLTAPQPPADALLHAHARHALAALPADASDVAGLPFDRLAHALAASQSLEELARRLRHDTQRPLLRGGDPLLKLRQLYRERDPLYRRTAHY